MSGDTSATPLYSPDGRFVWQDNTWVAVAPAPPTGAPGFPGGYQQPPYGAAPPPTMPHWGPSPYSVHVPHATPKSNALAIVLSFLWPGAGHLYVGADYPGGSNDKAILFTVLSGVCFLLSLTLVGLVVSFPLWLGCAIYTMIDANRCAQAWNASRGFPVNA